jgi:hypothetical protein
MHSLIAPGFVYILVFPLGFIAEYFVDTIGNRLYIVWHEWLVPMLTFAQVTMTVIGFLIVVASIEKYVASIHHVDFWPRHRVMMALAAVGMACVFKVSNNVSTLHAQCPCIAGHLPV